jgi:predicted PurR-regulated permease PerM
MTGGAALLLLVALCLFGLVLIKGTPDAIAFVRHMLEQQGPGSRLAPLSAKVASWTNGALARWAQASRDLPSQLAHSPQVTQALGVAARLVGSATHFVLMAGLMIVALFCLLREGPDLIDWAERTSTMPPGRLRSIVSELAEVSKSVFGAQLGSGLVQSAAATVGYAVSGVPRPLVFGVLSLGASLLPIGGVSLVGVPLAGLLWLMGRPAWAIFLAVWTTLATGLIDDVVRPLLVRGKTQLNGALVFFAMVGGILLLGPIGLVVGPLALALFLNVSGVERRERS